MGIRFPSILVSKQFLKQGSLSVPKGYCAVSAGDDLKRRYVIPISYLNHPCFQRLLREAAEEFCFHHSMGGLTIPGKDDIFNDLISYLNEAY